MRRLGHSTGVHLTSSIPRPRSGCRRSWKRPLLPCNLVPGQQVRVNFVQPQVGGATQLMLPPSAVVRRGELTAVYVATNGAFSLRAVRLGVQRGVAGLEVLAGVKAGESVALDPNRAGFANAVPAAATAPNAATAK